MPTEREGGTQKEEKEEGKRKRKRSHSQVRMREDVVQIRRRGKEKRRRVCVSSDTQKKGERKACKSLSRNPTHGTSRTSQPRVEAINARHEELMDLW